MRLRGIKRGQNIEVSEQINHIPDGTEIIIEVGFLTNQSLETQSSLSEAEKLAKINQLFGAWSNQPELTEIFAEIDQQRHTYQGRNIDPLDKQD